MGHMHISSSVGAHAICQDMYPLGVAVLAQNVIVEWVTASVLFVGEFYPAVFTLVTFHMEAAVEGDYAHCLFPSRPWHYRVVAH